MLKTNLGTVHTEGSSCDRKELDQGRYGDSTSAFKSIIPSFDYANLNSQEYHCEGEDIVYVCGPMEI